MKQAATTSLLCAMLLAGSAAADGFWPSKGASASNGLLKADQAFRLIAAERDGDSLKVSWDIAPGYYLYRKRLGFQVAQPQGGKLEAPVLPTGETVRDEHEGSTEIYRDSLQAVLHWPRGAAAPQQLRVNWQGCAEAGVCYPPQSRLIDVVDPGH
jgi:thiol:disulfide interchange protein DsbD